MIYRWLNIRQEKQMYKNGDKVGPYDIILLERTEKTSSGH